MSQLDWQKRYEIGDTPWDKGAAHPALPSFLSIHAGLFTPDQDVLIPGCGFGYDAALIAPKAHHVTALDIASDPLTKGRELHPAENIGWLQGDFFALSQEHQGRYDVIWEHTCFCAIPLERRDDYAESAAELLKPNGLLCGVFFLNPDHHPDEGPPFGVSRAELQEHFGPHFELLWDLPPRATYEGREGRETLMLWRRKFMKKEEPA